MVVLNFYGKIPRICISKKLGLYLSNLPNEENNDWQDELSKEFCLAQEVDRIYQDKLETNYPCGIFKLYKKVFHEKCLPEAFEKKEYDELASNMIYLDFDYSYDDMPLGGWDTNCFEGRLCEEDYAEKIIDFINFLSYPYDDMSISFPKPVPQWTYSSNHDEVDHYRIFWGGETASEYMCSLKEWGKLFDTFLQCKNDYLLFDYLVNSIHKDNEYNEYHLMKAYSLCQLFLEKEHESELDSKLPLFLGQGFASDNERKKCASILRKLRNKIAHGDFVAFENHIEQYAVAFMDGKFAFDYSEYSRKNWVVQHVCCQIDEILRQLIHMLFYDRTKLEQLKKNR
ncbi:hypothetical protein SAMN02745136_04629 [Anaerocolumna jejuensis DSM 15929]|uniref:Apea-like HEPN domain-containing protein n=1 Tax=Anaerocolumna jejuensis DSM 15929 TaxID=1121322 RepID=A0A1M6ZMG9_9FIRM|nr:hypothetical protein [Anaerocolumna jejuensis]SHL31594.1 hypothetical protein SAMN02745136_04629 [Anaerocolumna jejuensis DSM 15929]